MNAEINTSPELICTTSDLVSGSGVAAIYGGQQIALFYLPNDPEQQLYVIGNHDPIGQANVLSRGVLGDVKGEPVVASPLYKQHFSLRDGHCIEDDSVHVPVFKANIVEAEVYVYGEITP